MEDKKMCELCGKYEAEYQCDYCGKVVCQHCYMSEGICEECYDEREECYEDNHSIFGL